MFVSNNRRRSIATDGNYDVLLKLIRIRFSAVSDKSNGNDIMQYFILNLQVAITEQALTCCILSYF